MKRFKNTASNGGLLQELQSLARDDVQQETFRLSLRGQILRQAEMQWAGVPGGVSQTSTIAERRQRRSASGRGRTSLASLIAVALLVLGGFAGYLRFQAPTPVSAAQILHRAAAALTAADADHIIHEVATIRSSTVAGLRVHADGLGLLGLAGQPAHDASVDEWTQLSADGGVSRQDVTITDTPTGTLLSHRVVTGQDMFSYYWAIDGTTITPGGAAVWRRVLASGLPISVLDLESGGQAGLHQFLLDAQVGQNARYLEQQTVDGRRVDVIQMTSPLHVAGWPTGDVGKIPNRVNFTLYIDAQSYLIHRVVADTMSAQGETLSSTTLQIVRHDLVPATSLPPGIFSFTSPPGACVVTVNLQEPSRSTESKPCSGLVRPPMVSVHR